MVGEVLLHDGVWVLLECFQHLIPFDVVVESFDELFVSGLQIAFVLKLRLDLLDLLEGTVVILEKFLEHEFVILIAFLE